MGENKLKSNEVPQKFTEWLLSMGCPPDKVPSVDKISQMCRGEYYMVWRSLMEHVFPKDIIKQKRLHVFCDDVHRCDNKNVFNELGKDVVVPEEILVWREHMELKNKVAETEARVILARQKLKQLMNKECSKLSRRNSARRRIEDIQRRVWLLQRLSDELQMEKANINETKDIAKSFSSPADDVNVQGKLDKCITALRRQSAMSNVASLSLSMNPVACSSAVSCNNDIKDTEEQMSSVIRCSGDAVWAQLLERRAALAAPLAAANVREQHSHATHDTQFTPQSVLARTAALQCTLGLETTKNRLLVRKTQEELSKAISNLNEYLTSEECAMVTLRCEQARCKARVATLRELLDDVTLQNGVFNAADSQSGDVHATPADIVAIDKTIERKKDELSKLITLLNTTERKMQNVQECLVGVFNSFQKDSSVIDELKDLQVDLPQESTATLKRFFEEKRERNQNKMKLSFDMDVSDVSFTNNLENNMRFIDELRIYLKNFSLEKNRKLVLDSGEKIWIIETLQSSLERLYINDDAICSLVRPTVSLSHEIQRLIEDVQSKQMLEILLKNSKTDSNKLDIAIKPPYEAEEQIRDKIKKRLNDNHVSLKRTCKTLELGNDNWKLWSKNHIKDYISPSRVIDGKNYKYYEAYYLENSNF